MISTDAVSTDKTTLQLHTNTQSESRATSNSNSFYTAGYNNLSLSLIIPGLHVHQYRILAIVVHHTIYHDHRNKLVMWPQQAEMKL